MLDELPQLNQVLYLLALNIVEDLEAVKERVESRHGRSAICDPPCLEVLFHHRTDQENPRQLGERQPFRTLCSLSRWWM